MKIATLTFMVVEWEIPYIEGGKAQAIQSKDLFLGKTTLKENKIIETGTHYSYKDGNGVWKAACLCSFADKERATETANKISGEMKKNKAFSFFDIKTKDASSKKLKEILQPTISKRPLPVQNKQPTISSLSSGNKRRKLSNPSSQPELLNGEKATVKTVGEKRTRGSRNKESDERQPVISKRPEPKRRKLSKSRSPSQPELPSKLPNDRDPNAPGPVTYVPTEDTSESALFDSTRYAAGINFKKYKNIPCKVTGPGSELVRPCETFSELSFGDQVQRNIARSGYTEPTPVQKWALPIICDGKDIMACAQTGSGKTAAFVLPMINIINSSGVSSSEFSQTQTPDAMVITPTRELADQIHKETLKFSFSTMCKAQKTYEGVSVMHQRSNIRKGCNVIIGTPGRMKQFVDDGTISMQNIKFFVLDEADRMLDMGFQSEIEFFAKAPGMPDKTQRQTLLFSATFPEEVQQVAKMFLRNDHQFLTVGIVGSAQTDVSQHVLEVDGRSKTSKVKEVLNEIIGQQEDVRTVEDKRNTGSQDGQSVERRKLSNSPSQLEQRNEVQEGITWTVGDTSEQPSKDGTIATNTEQVIRVKNEYGAHRRDAEQKEKEKSTDEQMKELLNAVKSLEKRVNMLESTNMKMAAELEKSKARQCLLEDRLSKVCHPDFARAQQVWMTEPPAPPVAVETPAKADIELPATTDGGVVEQEIRGLLSKNDKRTTEALRDHNSCWRYVLTTYYDDTYLKKLKLAPIVGAAKRDIALFENGLYDHYMSNNLFVALIVIGRERYPTVLRTNRRARKHLSYLLQNIKKKIREKEAAEETAQSTAFRAVQEAALFSPNAPLVPMNLTSMCPVELTLNSTAALDDSATPSSSWSILDEIQ